MTSGNATVEDWQRDAARLPIQWTGELDDDCTAMWAGLMLRAEAMADSEWWWAVYDAKTNVIIGDSNTPLAFVATGVEARAAAERVAKKWLA